MHALDGVVGKGPSRRRRLCGDVNDQKMTVQKSSDGGCRGKGTAGTSVLMFRRKGLKASVARATAIHGECDLSEVRSSDVGSWPEHLEDCRS